MVFSQLDKLAIFTRIMNALFYPKELTHIRCACIICELNKSFFFLCCNFSFALDMVGATFLTCSVNCTLLQFEMRNAEDTSLKIKCHNQLIEATQKAVTELLNYMYEGFLIAELSHSPDASAPRYERSRPNTSRHGAAPKEIR